MTGLIILGAERSGVSMLARALAHAQSLPLCDDIALAARRMAKGERLVAFAPDLTSDCPHLSLLPKILAECGEARALVVWRDGVDFVNSRLRMYPDQHFVDHCRLWARSAEKALDLAGRMPKRVELIAFRNLTDLSTPRARRRPLVSGFSLTSEGLTQFINASARGRTSLMPRHPVLEAARAAWSMGEVEAFARICGRVLQEFGGRVDLAAAARRRPLDLARMLHERAYRVGDIDIAPSPIAGSRWTIAVAGAGAAQLRLTAVPAGERRRLRLHLHAKAAPAARLRWEAVEASTRRPLFAAPCLESGQTRLESVLPTHDGTIEVALVCSELEPGACLALGLIDAQLSLV